MLSDDSHGVDHVATNYARLPRFLEQVGISHLYAMQQVPNPNGTIDQPKFEFVKHELAAVMALDFWKGA